MMFPMQHAEAPSSGPLPTDLPPALCIIGLGLIGGSLARAVRDRLPVTGWSPSEETRAAAAGDGFDVADPWTPLWPVRRSGTRWLCSPPR